MRLYAKQPCSFGGKNYRIGDYIPVSDVMSPKDQERRGVLAIVNDGAPIPSNVDCVRFEIVIHTEKEDIPLQVTNEELSVFTDILQIDVNKAADKQQISDMIQKIESNDLLIMLDSLDGRKFVKEEAQKRAEVISTGGDA